MGPKSEITGAILRKMVVYHRAPEGPRCVFGVAIGPTGTRFLGKDEAARPNERVEYLDRCPVCGAKYGN